MKITINESSIPSKMLCGKQIWDTPGLYDRDDDLIFIGHNNSVGERVRMYITNTPSLPNLPLSREWATDTSKQLKRSDRSITISNT